MAEFLQMKLVAAYYLCKPTLDRHPSLPSFALVMFRLSLNCCESQQVKASLRYDWMQYSDLSSMFFSTHFSPQFLFALRPQGAAN